MTLKLLLEAVKEKGLSKEQLESYRDDLAGLYAQMKLEFAELEKKEALYVLANQEISWAGKKAMWKGTEEGQRMIELKHYIGATSKVIDSLKSRLYSQYI